MTLLTPPGRGALSVVAMWGADATRLVEGLFLARGGTPVGAWAPGRIGVGRWRGRGDGEKAMVTAEEVLVVRTVRGWEVHCHGGTAAAAAVVDDLVRLGAESVAPVEWSGDDRPTVAADARALLSQIDAPRGARILCRQMAGELDAELDRIAGLVGRGDVAAARSLAERLHRAARVGLRLASPWRVAFRGGVNVGKSSLVNALAGHSRSLVSPLPGTTRDVIEAHLVVDGWSVVVIDTAGLREANDTATGVAERAGIARGQAATRESDLVIDVVEAGAASFPSDGLVVWSKADLHPDEPVPDGVIPTSAVTGQGIVGLASALVARLVPEAADPGLLDGAVPFLPWHLERIDELIRGDSSGGRRSGQ